MFVMLASLAAPSTLTCLDIEDLTAVWSGADTAAVLAEAVWLKHAGELVFHSQEHREAVRETECAVLVVDAPGIRTSDLGRIAVAVRADMRMPDALMYLAPEELLTSSHLRPGIASVSILCKVAHRKARGSRHHALEGSS